VQGSQGASYAEGALNLSEAAAAVLGRYNLTDFEEPAELMESTATALLSALSEVNVTLITARVVACAELSSTSYLALLNASGQYYLALSPSPLSGEVELEVTGRVGLVILVAPRGG
jgi:hypothetical protein